MSTTEPAAANVSPPATPPVVRRSKPTGRTSWQGKLTLAGLALFIVGLLALPRFWTEPGEHAPGGGQEKPVDRSATAAPISAPAPAAPALSTAPAAVSPDAAMETVLPPSKKAAVLKTNKTRTGAPAKSAAPVGVETPAAAPGNDASGGALLGVPEPITAGPAPASTTVSVGPPSVTITGCLEINVNEDGFRLTDTEGVEAPKSRSWRTGFLKKRTAPVALVEPPDPQGLQMQVGKRVAATGFLTSRQLKVSSLRVVGGACN